MFANRLGSDRQVFRIARCCPGAGWPRQPVAGSCARGPVRGPDPSRTDAGLASEAGSPLRTRGPARPRGTSRRGPARRASGSPRRGAGSSRPGSVECCALFVLVCLFLSCCCCFHYLYMRTCTISMSVPGAAHPRRFCIYFQGP